MAEETVRVPDSPDVNRSWRRISTGKLSFLYRQDNIVPNYLRSPTVSCHDVCKYGTTHESHDKPRKVKRVNRSFSGTLTFDSPLKKKNKKALTKPVLNPSFGYGRYDSGDDHAMSKARDFSRRVCDVNMKNAERRSRKAVSLSDSQLADSTRLKKKTVSHSFETFCVSRGRELEMVEHNKRVTALKLKSVAQTAGKALRRSTVNRKKGTEPKKVVLPLRAPVSSKRCSRNLKTKESNSSSVPLMKPQKGDEKCKDLVEEKTLYVIKMKTGNEIVESDQNQRCVVDPPIDDPSSSLQKSRDEGEEFVIESSETEEDNESSQEEEEEEEHEDDHDENASFTEDKKNTIRQGKSKAGKPMKLRFNRGKVVDSGSQGNSRRKLVNRADTTSKPGVQRNLKSKGTNFSNDKEQEHKPKSLKVVLKHQETKKKRDSRVLLFNNVIEETANKLVVTRKSKVKALVGAFESVISLQEKNSCPPTLKT